MRAALVLLVALLAGCADDAGPPAASTPGATSPVATTPTSTTPVATTPGTVWAGVVNVTIAASRTSVRAGEEVAVTLAASNQREGSIWTNPEFVCTGSWDMVVRDGSGARVRVDDRDAMGCPSTDTYEGEVRPGESVTALYTWDGRVRPSLGEAMPAPPGTYTFEGIVRYATEVGPSNGARAEVANATITIQVVR